MTAEECLLCSLFAMVSSGRHVRNARARTTGLGMRQLWDEFSQCDLESPLV